MFVIYIVICSMIVLERLEFREKVMLLYFLCGYVMKFFIYKKIYFLFDEGIFMFKFSCLIYLFYKVDKLYKFM